MNDEPSPPTGARRARSARTGEGVGADTARLCAALEAAAGWYRARLLADRPAAVVGLLRDRGLADLGVDTPAGMRWRVGYAPGGPGRVGLVGYLRGREFTEGEVVAAGLAAPARSDGGAGRWGSGRWGSGVVDVLRHRLVVPLVDAGGVVGFTARRLADDNPAVPKWVNTATTAVYRKSDHLVGLGQQAERVAAGRGRVVLVEGAVDAIAVDLAGDIGLAAGGTRLTEAHAAQLRAAAARTGGRLLVAYDADGAGREATVRAAGMLAGVDAHVVRLPAGQDPADVLVATGARGLRRALAVTVSLVDAAVTARLDRWKVHAGNPVALVDAVRDVAPLVTAAPADARARLIRLVAAHLQLPVDLVIGTLLDAVAPPPPVGPDTHGDGAPPRRRPT